MEYIILVTVIGSVMFIECITLDYGKGRMSNNATKEALSILNAAKVETRDVLGRRTGQFYFEAENPGHMDRLIKAVAQVYENNCGAYTKLIRLQESRS